MKRLLRGLAIAAAAIAPVMASVPANGASADTFAITGGGTITPGLGLFLANNTFHFSGTGTNVGTDGVAVTVTCAAIGDDVGNFAAGQGNTTVTCNIGAKVIVIVCVFVRVGPLVIVASGRARPGAHRRSG